MSTFVTAPDLKLDPFAFRQFDDPTYGGTKLSSVTKEDFMKGAVAAAVKEPLRDGYAPFCKHIFIPNFVEGAKVGAIEIAGNESKLKSGYKARTEKELPVLMRWFDKDDIETPDAKYLDLILYSKDQIVKESGAMNVDVDDSDYTWGIISVKGQLENFETPMTPMTMLRNSLGREEGGSGVPLDREKYMESVTYWKTHASIV